jgi:hypothetical protein
VILPTNKNMLLEIVESLYKTVVRWLGALMAWLVT